MSLYRNGVNRCYRCEQGRPTREFQSLCPTCLADLKAKHAKPPAKEFCSCGYRFFNDWERVKHEVVGSHHYRAWRAPS